ncbi:MAG: ATP-grasp domain-containing protein [Kordiimonadaceae bacterium]|nr:ATP-grasp domain-containing protein [Kordiimonadaceae bacterium]
MKKRILVLGGSRQAVTGLEQLKALGLDVVVCDFDPSAPGFRLADHTILASVYHIDDCLPAAVEFHKRHPLDGVMCLACDVPHIVARIASSLGLPGLPHDVADRAVNKMEMKQKFEEGGVSIPRYWATADVASLENILSGDFPDLVVKPVDSRGSKGVSRLSRGGNAVWAFDYAQANSPTGQVMAEEYITGPQVSSESVVIDGQTVTPALSDRSYQFLEKYYPFIVEDGGDMPTCLPPETVANIKALVHQAAASLGVKNGVVKGDIVVRDGKPYVIELAARLSGGYYCTHQIPFSTGVKLVEACAKLALGEKLNPDDWHQKKNTHASTRWKLVEPGLVASVPPLEDVMAVPGVLAFEHWLKVGDVITAAQNAAASVAMVQTEGASQQEARSRAIKALDTFQPDIQPPLT